MAFVDWIKVEHTTPRKAEVLRMASILKISPYEVLGRLIELWIWADQNTVDGKTFVQEMSQIDHLTGRTNFGQAMKDSGWLTVEGTGFTFPNFLRHNGKSAKRRAEDARKKKSKRTNVPSSRGQKEDEDMEPSSSSSTSTSSSKEGGVGETEADPWQDLPPALATDDFKAAWTRWEKYLTEDKGKDFFPSQRLPAWTELLAKATKGSESIYAVSMVNRAIAGGWVWFYQSAEKDPKQQAKPTDDKLLIAAQKALAYARTTKTSDADFLAYGNIPREFKLQALELEKQNGSAA